MNSHPELMLQIGKIIKARRETLNIKEETLAKAIGKTQAVISQIENGKYDCVKTTLLIDICNYLQIPPNDLFTPPSSME